MRNLVARAFLKVTSTYQTPENGPDIHDEYVDWLCFANAGMLYRGLLASD